MPRRGRRTRVAFTAFLQVSRAAVRQPWQRDCRRQAEWIIKAGAALQASSDLPVLDGLWRGGGSQFGHEDSHDVEEENEIDLRGNKRSKGVRETSAVCYWQVRANADSRREENSLSLLKIWTWSHLETDFKYRKSASYCLLIRHNKTLWTQIPSYK